MKRSSCVFFLVLSFSLSTAAQSVSTDQTNVIRRDAAALAAVQSAISVMGGSSVAAGVQNVVAQGTLAAPSAGAGPSGNVIFEDLFTGQSHEFRDRFQSIAGSQTFVSGHGNPGLSVAGHNFAKLQQMASFRIPVHLPILVLMQSLTNQNCNIEFVGTTSINGQSAVQIHLHTDTDVLQQALSVQDWYFDPASGLPIRLEYRLPDATTPGFYLPAAVDFSNYQNVQGILFPFRLISYRDGTTTGTLSISTITINGPVSSSDFDLATAVSQ